MSYEFPNFCLFIRPSARASICSSVQSIIWVQIDIYLWNLVHMFSNNQLTLIAIFAQCKYCRSAKIGVIRQKKLLFPIQFNFKFPLIFHFPVYSSRTNQCTRIQFSTNSAFMTKNCPDRTKTIQSPVFIVKFLPKILVIISDIFYWNLERIYSDIARLYPSLLVLYQIDNYVIVANITFFFGIHLYTWLNNIRLLR